MKLYIQLISENFSISASELIHRFILYWIYSNMSYEEQLFTHDKN